MRISICLILLLVFLSEPNESQILTIHHIDVGQGDATFIQVANGKNLLIDGGNRGKGNTTVLPYLTALGVSSIDYVIASHYHSDHIGGLNEVIEQLSPDSIHAFLDRGFKKPLPRSKVFAAYQSLVDRLPVHTAASPGQVIRLSNAVTLQCVASDGATIHSDEQDGMTGGEPSNGLLDENDRSLVWVLTSVHRFGQSTYSFRYFTGGDWSDTSNTTLPCAVGDVDVMKVSHHGSAAATSRSLLNVLMPEAAVISVGDRNRYGHPRQQCLDCFQNTPSVQHIYQTEEGEGGCVPKVRVLGNVIVSVFDSFYVVTRDTFWLKADTLRSLNEGRERSHLDSGSSGSAYPSCRDEVSVARIDVDEEGPATIKIFNILGHVVWVRLQKNLAPGPFRLDLSPLHLPRGIYFLTMQTNLHHSVKKVIVLR